jgi:cystathionine beta-lyase/cystathionine gamma-synthase
MSNPLLRVGDLRAVVDFAHAHRLVSMIDNTFASPVNFRPPEWGFDISIHSCTKYVNGHDDIAAGAVIGRAAWVERIARYLSRLGGSLDPHAAFLLDRGMKTLGVRMRYQNESALRIACFLEAHPTVQRVNYPGLKSHPRHARAAELFDGFGGTLSFNLADGAAASRLMARLRLPVAAPSLGGVHSLIMQPARISHGGLSPEERERMGIGDGLLRLSVGLETTEDLIEDLEEALRA